MELSDLMGAPAGSPMAAQQQPTAAPERQAIIDRLLRSGVPMEQISNPETLLSQGVISESEYQVLRTTQIRAA